MHNNTSLNNINQNKHFGNPWTTLFVIFLKTSNFQSCIRKCFNKLKLPKNLISRHHKSIFQPCAKNLKV